MAFIVFIQAKGNMRRNEILAAPLLLLNSIHKELVEIVQNEMAVSMGGLLGGAAQPQRKSSAVSLLGETPTFKTREEYEAYLKNKGID